VTPSPKTAFFAQLLWQLPAAIWHSRSITPNRPTCAQHWQWGYSDLFGVEIFSRYRALATVSCAFTGLIFQNRFETISFLTFWTANREITTSCAFLQLFLRSTFLWRPLGPPYLQKQWFVHFDLFTNAHCTRSRIVPVCFCNLLFPPANCYCWLCGWHDSKIDHGRSSGTRKASEACKLTFVEHVPRLKIQPDGKPLIHSRSCDRLKSTEGVL
jgi:hypothetical protein